MTVHAVLNKNHPIVEKMVSHKLISSVFYFVGIFLTEIACSSSMAERTVTCEKKNKDINGILELIYISTRPLGEYATQIHRVSDPGVFAQNVFRIFSC